METQNLLERTREYISDLGEQTGKYIPKALYAVSTAMCLVGMGPNGGVHNPYNTFNIAVAYLIGREIPKESNVHGVKNFRNVMLLFGGALFVPLVYNSIRKSGISLGDLLFSGSLGIAALGAEIERRNLENIVEAPEEVTVLEG